MNICGLRPPARDRLRRESVMSPHRVGRRRVIGRQVLRAFARGDDVETRRARPVDHLADQRRLVAIRERVDDAGVGRALREQRTGERVGFDVDHHHVLAVAAAREHMTDACGGIAGRVDDDLGLRSGDRRVRVVGDERRAARCGVRKGSRAVLFRQTSHVVASAARARSGERSATAVRCSPRVVRACDRNIEPNLPAPISATRSGLR